MKKLVLIATAILAAFGWAQAQFTIENFDNRSLGFFNTTTGGYSGFNATATLAGISGSTYAGYGVKGSDNFSNLNYVLTSTSLFTSTTVSALKNGTLKLRLKVATQASSGIQVRIKLQSSTLTNQANNYSGNSEYSAITTIGGTSNPYNWETLTLDATTVTGTITDAQVDNIIIFFAFNTGSTDAFFFDNLEVFDPTATTTGTSTGFNENYEAEKTTLVYPNPANGLTTIEYAQATSTDVKVSLNDVMGREVAQVETVSAGTAYRGQVDVSSLEPGIYYVNFQEAGVAKRMKKLVVTK